MTHRPVRFHTLEIAFDEILLVSLFFLLKRGIESKRSSILVIPIFSEPQRKRSKTDFRTDFIREFFARYTVARVFRPTKVRRACASVLFLFCRMMMYFYYGNRVFAARGVTEFFFSRAREIRERNEYIFRRMILRRSRIPGNE